MTDFYDDDDQANMVSKTQIKKDMQALQDLGIRLMDLNKDQLEEVPLTEHLIAALDESKRIKSHEARRRHAQYLGKLIRKTDYEAIERAVALLDSSSDTFARFHQQVERWRDLLIANSKESLPEFIDRFPHTDRQHLRQLVKNSETENRLHPNTWTTRKKLFQYLKEVMKDSVDMD